MNSDNVINRRKILIAVTGLGIGASVPASGAPQRAQEPKLPFPPREFGTIHNDMLRRISSGESINTKAGLLKVVNLLLEMEAISGADAGVLRELISVMFSSSDPEIVARKIHQLYNQAVPKVGSVTAAVLSIARESIDYSQNHLRQIAIVTSDVTGALTGAVTGIKLGPAFAAVGALAGAVGGSALTALKTKS